MSVGAWQIFLILVIILVLFGAGRLPGVMGDLGRGLRNFKEGLKGDLPSDKNGNDFVDSGDR